MSFSIHFIRIQILLMHTYITTLNWRAKVEDNWALSEWDYGLLSCSADTDQYGGPSFTGVASWMWARSLANIFILPNSRTNSKSNTGIHAGLIPVLQHTVTTEGKIRDHFLNREHFIGTVVWKLETQLISIKLPKASLFRANDRSEFPLLPFPANNKGWKQLVRKGKGLETHFLRSSSLRFFHLS